MILFLKNQIKCYNRLPYKGLIFFFFVLSYEDVNSQKIAQDIFITPSKQTNLYKKGWIDFNKNGTKDPYEDTSLSIEKRVADLLSQMTMSEKTAQLTTEQELLASK